MSADLRDPRWHEWQHTHQKFEVNWWRKALAGGHSREDAAFAFQWNPVREFIQPKGRVLDIGCGPRPPFLPCVVIEPLANEYIKMTPPAWWTGVDVIAQPAEHIIDTLRARFDTVICWNCIDHCADWRGVLEAMRAYGAEGARYAVATDFQEPFEGHPGVGSQEEFLEEVNKRFREIRRSEGQPHWRALSLLLEAS